MQRKLSKNTDATFIRIFRQTANIIDKLTYSWVK